MFEYRPTPPPEDKDSGLDFDQIVENRDAVMSAMDSITGPINNLLAPTAFEEALMKAEESATAIKFEAPDEAQQVRLTKEAEQHQVQKRWESQQQVEDTWPIFDKNGQEVTLNGKSIGQILRDIREGGAQLTTPGNVYSPEAYRIQLREAGFEPSSRERILLEDRIQSEYFKHRRTLTRTAIRTLRVQIERQNHLSGTYFSLHEIFPKEMFHRDLPIEGHKIWDRALQWFMDRYIYPQDLEDFKDTLIKYLEVVVGDDFKPFPNYADNDRYPDLKDKLENDGLI